MCIRDRAIPERLENYPYNLKVFLIVLILAGLAAFIFRSCRHFTRESVLITMGILYDVIFIGIRYVSSMDSFYFRFFEPGTFLICIGPVSYTHLDVYKRQGTGGKLCLS